MKIRWTHGTLYDDPKTGVCEVSGAYETGRMYVKEDGKPIFVGNTAAPDAVEDYAGFLTALDTVEAFKRGYPKRDRVESRIEKKKKKKKR